MAVINADCLEGMSWFEPDSIDAIVTDPPYELGFMGKSWDASGVAFRVDVWREALRVLKPGGHLLAFSGSRTYHRMAVAIEDAGFEIRDQIMWVYGSGFPKSHDVSKAIDHEAGVHREVVGYKMGVRGAEGTGYENQMPAKIPGVPKVQVQIPITTPATDDAQRWQGWGTALKPAHEPIVMARKPLIGTVAQNVLAHGTGCINVDECRIQAQDAPEGRMRHGGGIKDNASSYWLEDNKQKMPAGRWPANLIHDGSEEVLEGFPGADETSAARFFYCSKASKADRDEGLDGWVEKRAGVLRGSEDGSLKTGAGEERTTSRKNTHPTVKPTDLMRYLCRMITPPGGTVLDPFAGSGSTGKAAVLEGFQFVGFELSEEYTDLANARIEAARQRRG